MPPVSTTDSWWTWFSKFQDEQRLERLQQCRQLQDVLTQCEAAAVSNKAAHRIQASNTFSPSAVEEFSGGLRIMKYFGWRGILKEEEEVESEGEPRGRLPVKLRQAIVTSCARERHAMWACRAVAVGCGKELGALKIGFDEQGPLAILHDPRTAYEPTSTTATNAKSTAPSTIPCAELQATLGSCVQRGANELLERKKQRQDEVNT